MLSGNLRMVATKGINNVIIPLRRRGGLERSRRREDTANCDTVRHDSMAADATHQKELEKAGEREYV